MTACEPSTATSTVRTSCTGLARCTGKRSRNVRSSSMITILADRSSRTLGEPAYHGPDAESSNYARLTPLARSGLTRVRGGELGVNGEDALAELEQVRIAHAVFDQTVHRLEQVFGRRAQLAARAHQGLDDGLERELAGVVGVRAVDEKGHCPQRFPARIDLRPARRVGAEHHFATPQETQLVRRVVSGDAIRHPAAAAAGVEAEHESGPLQRAAVDVRPQAEAAVKAVQPRDAPLLVMNDRVPDERAVAEQPYVRARLVPVENLPERGFLLLVGEHPHLRIEPAKGRPQQVVLEVGTGEGHATRLSPKGATRGMRRAARLPSSSPRRGGGA